MARPWELGIPPRPARTRDELIERWAVRDDRYLERYGRRGIRLGAEDPIDDGALSAVRTVRISEAREIGDARLEAIARAWIPPHWIHSR